MGFSGCGFVGGVVVVVMVEVVAVMTMVEVVFAAAIVVNY